MRPRPFVRKRLQLAVTGRNWQQLATTGKRNVRKMLTF
nr:MAG TPA: hypothetical protein [Bacteriophage sp.]